MKNKVIELLVKHGNNQKSVNEMINANFEYAVRTYPESKPSFIAKVLSSLR